MDPDSLKLETGDVTTNDIFSNHNPDDLHGRLAQHPDRLQAVMALHEEFSWEQIRGNTGTLSPVYLERGLIL